MQKARPRKAHRLTHKPSPAASRVTNHKGVKQMNIQEEVRLICLAICEQEDKRKAFEAIAAFGFGIAAMMAAVGNNRPQVEHSVDELCTAIKNDCMRAFDAAQKAAESHQSVAFDELLKHHFHPEPGAFNA